MSQSSNQRTIEILPRFKQAGQEIIKQAEASIQGLAPAAAEATAATATLASAGTQNLQQVGTAAKAAGQQVAQGMQQGAVAGRESLSQVGAAAQVAGQQVAQGMQQGTKQATSSFRQMLLDIRAEGGRSSNLGMITKLLAGGGIVMGLGFAASEFANFGKQIADAADEARKGDATFGQTIGTLAREVPILGGLTKGFDALREAITGEQVALDQQAAGVKAMDEQWKGVQTILEQGKKITQDWIVTVQKLREEFRLLSATPELRELVKTEISVEDELAGLRKKYEEQAKLDEVEKAKVARDGLKAQRDAAKAEIAELQALDAQAKAGQPMSDTQVDRYKDLVSRLHDRGGPMDNVLRLTTANAAIDAMDAKVADATNKFMALNAEARKALAGYTEARAAAVKVAAKELTDAQNKVQQPAYDKAAESVLGTAKAEAESIKTQLSEHAKSFMDVIKEMGKAREQLDAEAKKIHEETQTPQQKFDSGKDQATNMLQGGFISPQDYQTRLNQLQAELDKSLSVQVQKQDEAAVAMAAGIDKQKAEAKLAYDRDVANFKQAMDLKQMSEAQYAAAVKAAEQVMQDQIAKIDKDAAQKQLEAQQKLQEQQRQAAEKAQQMQDIATRGGLLHVQAGGNPQAIALAQIEAQAQAERAQWDKFHADGLTDERTYQQALLDIDRQYNRQKQAINGTFFQGMQQGFQQAVDAIKTPAQMGAQLAGNLTTGLTDVFTSILNGSKSAAAAFKQFAASILMDIAKMIIEFEILSMVKAALGFFSAGAGGGAMAGASAGASAGTAAAPAGGGAFAGALAGANQGGLITLAGVIRKFARGGMVGGSGPDRDSVPALLTPGEFVVRRSVVAAPGMLGMLHKMNAGMAHFATGGMVAPLLGQATMPAGAAGAGTGGGAGGTFVQSAVVASEANMRTLMAGGQNAVLDFMRSNASKINAVLGNRGGR